MNCKVCGNNLPDGAKVCELCGSPVEIVSPKTPPVETASPKTPPVETASPETPSVETASPEMPPVEASKNAGSTKDNPPSSGGNDPFAYTNPIESEPYSESYKTAVISGRQDKQNNDRIISFKLTHAITAAVIALVIAGIVVTCILYSNAHKNNSISKNTYAETVRTANPVSETATPTPEPRPTVDISRIDSIISANAHNATTSVYIIDLKRGISYGTANAHVPMSASALTTVPILYATDSIVSDSNKELRDIQIPFRYTTSGTGRTNI